MFALLSMFGLLFHSPTYDLVPEVQLYGSASEGELGTYQTVTLEIEDGQDITAPLNTLFLQLKEQASEETPCKVIIPPGNYKLTGTLCMYSNMYLYAKGATITKTCRRSLYFGFRFIELLSSCCGSVL